LQFLKRPIVILSVFVGFKAFQAYLSFMQGEEVDYMPWVRLGGVVFLLVVSIFVLKRNKVALWVMGLFLISNILAVAWGLFLIPMQQYVIKFVAVVLGSYFVYGGFVLINQARALATKGITNH
jgi:hypothetical protein